jgi:hypothetical protein
MADNHPIFHAPLAWIIGVRFPACQVLPIKKLHPASVIFAKRGE